MHLDLDAFFASVEQRDKPSLRGRPVIVGGTGLRGVVSTASYEARAFGARSAMSTAEARAICPAGTAFLSPRFEAYRAASQTVMGILRDLSPAVEPLSLDEAFVDLTPAGLTGYEKNVHANDAPGFIVNRVLMPMLNEACFALGEGVAGIADIDAAVTGLPVWGSLPSRVPRKVAGASA